jgi:hypothetical protein
MVNKDVKRSDNIQKCTQHRHSLLAEYCCQK